MILGPARRRTLSPDAELTVADQRLLVAHLAQALRSRQPGAAVELIETHISFVLLAGGFAASHVLDVHGSRMLSRDFSPGLMAGTHADALGVVVDEAHALGLDLPGSALVAQQLNALVGAGEGALDSSALVKVLERMAGETR